MDRYRTGEWNFECNIGECSQKGNLKSYGHSFLSLQNQRAGIAYEFHTYEAVTLIDPALQSQRCYTEGQITGQHTRFCKPQDENSSFSSYIGDVKLSYRHGSIVMQESSDSIDIERLKRNDPILWFTEVNLFSFNNMTEKSDYTVKVRVMPEFFFCLARSSLFSARNVVRSMETRVFHEFGSDSILRVFTLKESKFEDLVARGSQFRFEGSKLHEELILDLEKKIEVSDKILLS